MNERTLQKSRWSLLRSVHRLYVATRVKDGDAHLVEREAGGRHADQHVEEVGDQLSLGVLRQWEQRGGRAAADHPHLALPQAVQLVEGLPAAFRQVQGLPFPRWAGGTKESGDI